MSFGSFFDYPETETPSPGHDIVLLPLWGEAEWSRLMPYVMTRRVRAGEIVIRAEEVDRSLYFITAGDLEVLLDVGHGRNARRLTLLRAGTIFGEQTFVDGQPRSATVRAVTDGEILRLSHDAFESFAARDPSLAQALIFDLARILSLRLRENLALLTRTLG